MRNANLALAAMLALSVNPAISGPPLCPEEPIRPPTPTPVRADNLARINAAEEKRRRKNAKRLADAKGGA